MFVLAQNLKNLKPILRNWNKEIIGDINSNVTQAMAKVDSI